MMMFYTFLNVLIVTMSGEVSHALSQYDLIVQSRMATSPFSSHMRTSSVRKIAGFDGIAKVQSVLLHRMQYRQKRFLVIGTEDVLPLMTKFGIVLHHGRMFSGRKNELIVGNKAMDVLRVSLDSTVNLGGLDWKVVGSFSSFSSLLEGSVVTGLRQAQHLNNDIEEVSLMLVTLKDRNRLSSILARINQKFPALYAIETSQINRSVTTVRDIERLLRILSVFSVIVSVAVIVNTLLITTMMRQREIGILTAIGWPRSAIVSVFLAESLSISIGAAVIGYVLAYPLTVGLREITSLGLYLSDAWDFATFVEVLVVAAGVGVVGLAAPLAVIFRSSASEALRYE